MIRIAILTLSGLLWAFVDVIGQNQPIEYHYDASGNRYLRKPCEGCIQQQPKDTLPMVLGADSVLLVEVTPTLAGESSQVTAEAQVIARNLAQVFPNPTAGDVNIHLENYGEITSCSVEIRDAGGRIIYSRDDPQPIYSLSLSGHPAGTYFVNLVVNGKQGRYTIVRQ